MLVSMDALSSGQQFYKIYRGLHLSYRITSQIICLVDQYCFSLYILLLPYLYDYLIKPLKKEYDLILFDVIPTTTSFTNNCIVASDYAVMPTQTEEDAYDNTKTYIDYLITMKEDYNPKLELVGIVPYLVANDSVDIKLLRKYQEEYPEITFNNLIKRSARVKTWGLEGISDYKPYDKRTLDMYDLVFQEMIERIALLKQVI